MASISRTGMERIGDGPLPVNPSCHGPVAEAKGTLTEVRRRFSDSAMCCRRGVMAICTSAVVDWRACSGGAGCLVVGSGLLAGLALKGGSTPGRGAASVMMSGSFRDDSCFPGHAIVMNLTGGTSRVRWIRR